MGKARQKNIKAFFGPGSPELAPAPARQAAPATQGGDRETGLRHMPRATTGGLMRGRAIGTGEGQGVRTPPDANLFGSRTPMTATATGSGTPLTATGMGGFSGGESDDEPVRGMKRALFDDGELDDDDDFGDVFGGQACKKARMDGDVAEVDEVVDDDGANFANKFAHGRKRQVGLPRARRVLAGVDFSGGCKEDVWREKNKWSVDVRDADQRRPGEKGFDASTLFVPRDKLNAMSPFQRQFWDLKSKYYDTILLVKKGAFFEAYDVDADILHKELGLNYTGGGRASMRCAGVPESTLNKHAARLIDMSFRVGIVVQTESANTVEKRKVGGKTSKAASICHRALVRILTKATVTDDNLLRDHRARYVLAIREAPVGTINAVGEIVVGVCYVDAASGRITFGEFLDDSRRSWTEKLLSTLQPPELIVPTKEAMTERMRSIVRWTETGTTSVDVQYRNDDGFPAMREEWLADYGGGEGGEKSLHVSGLPIGYFEAHPLGAQAFGAVASYLQHLLIDKEILSLGNFAVLPDIRPEDSALHQVDPAARRTGGPGSSSVCDRAPPMTQTRDYGASTASRHPGISVHQLSGSDYEPSRMVGTGLQMDSATMANLEVLANVVDGSERGALISVIDHAATPAGRRLLRRWISDPLALSAAINDRLNAVDALIAMGDDSRDLVRKDLSAGRDLERALPRLHQFAVVADVAVTYDQTNCRRVKEFVKVLRGLQNTLDGLDRVAKDLPQGVNARRLLWLVTPGFGYDENARKELDLFFTSYFDVTIAEKKGELVPHEGGSTNYDVAKAALDDVEEDLDAELRFWQKELQDPSLKYYSRGQETHQIEVKTATLKRAGRPRDFLPTSESKAAKRFHTSRIRTLVKFHVDASEAFDVAGVNLLRDIITRFDRQRATWTAVAQAAAEVDALLGLSIASQGDGSGRMARPEILPNSYPQAVLESRDLRHAVLAGKAGGSFVANDAYLGGGRASIALVTGSNQAGKSTFSRQVAIAVILAQIGCYVPASSLRLRPVEALFARAGSRDEIARGRSTFLVEMEEAALIVNTASDTSLVIVDELCSGTTASDAHALSHATLERLVEIGCLTVFCTHAEALAAEFAGRVGNFTMAANVNEAEKSILFLYKLVEGVTSESRGVFCARVAGVPARVADWAENIAADFEERRTEERRLRAFQKIATPGSLDDGALSLAKRVELLRVCG